MHESAPASSASVLRLTTPPEERTASPEVDLINDWQFIHDLKQLKDLRSFFIQEAIRLETRDSEPLAFGRLNLLRYDMKGRPPTEQEWSEVEKHSQTLFRLLDDQLRRRFLLGQIPSWVSVLPIILALLALAALIAAIISLKRELFGPFMGAAGVLLFYLVWLMCLGAIGSVAYIGMNALSVQQDVTFDLSNRRLMLLRISLGALFALVLTLPFGFQGFLDFITTIYSWGSRPASGQQNSVTVQALLLLLPFVLGFSTSLVIMVMNRLVDGVQSFFGRSGAGNQATPHEEPRSPQTARLGQPMSPTRG